jgi:hypothetical protein
MASRDERLKRLEREAGHLAERVLDRERRLRSALAQLEETGKLDFEVPAAPTKPARKRGLIGRSVAMAERLAEMARLGDLLEAAGLLPPASYQPAPREKGAEPPVAPGPSANGTRVADLEDGLFEGAVEIEIGPLADFAQLTGFEDAANAIGATGEIKVKRFSGGRATLSMDLDEPVELLRELEERAPLEFRVRSLKNDRVVLDVDEDEAAAA